MSIKFKNISIQNFLSFGQQPTTINLDSSNNTLIVGENRDVGSEGYSKNGVGKSTIFQALTWVLYNEGISSIKQDAFVNIINKKNMVVELELEVNGVEYVIRRGRKPAVCEVLKNGDPYTNHSISSVDDTIEDLVGINYDTFCNTIMLNTTTVPFMNLKPAGQRNFMEKMVGLDILSQRADTIKSKNKDLAIEIRLEEQSLEHAERALGKANDHVEYLVSKEFNWDHLNKSSIQETKDNIETLSEIDTVAIMRTNKEISDQAIIIDKLENEISNVANEELNECKVLKVAYDVVKVEILAERNLRVTTTENEKQKEIVKVMSSKSNLITDMNENKDLLTEATGIIKECYRTVSTNNIEMERLQTKIEGFEYDISSLESESAVLESGECPYCHQSHIDKVKVLDILNNIKSKRDSILKTYEDIKKLADENIQLEKDAAEIEGTLDDIKENIGTLENEIMAIDASIVTIDMQYQTKLSENHKEFVSSSEKAQSTWYDEDQEVKAKYQGSLEAMELERDKLVLNKMSSEFSDEECHEVLNNTKHLVERLKELKKEVNPYAEQVEKSKEDIVEVDSSKLDLMRKQENHYKLLVKLLTDNKSFVRKNLLDQYVPFINTKIEHYLDKLDLPHRIMINNDLSVDINYMNNPVSYGNLSNGEKGRTNFAVSMSFNDLMSVSGHQFNFLGVDELFDGQGMDSAGMYAVWKILKEKSDSIFVITHREELLSEADEIMTVVKENGFSKVM